MEKHVVTSKGQVTIPAHLRREIGLEVGDAVYWSKTPTGGLQLRVKNKTLSDLVPITPNPMRSYPTKEEMQAAYTEGASERYLRYLDQDKK